MLKRKLRGFTLIELLTVITIIAVLSALLFPVISRAKESANKADCISNLKQIGIAFQMYTSDYDERMNPIVVPQNGWESFEVLPGLVFKIFAPGAICNWSECIQPHGEEDGLLTPYLGSGAAKTCRSTTGPWRLGRLYANYEMNVYLDNRLYPPGTIYTGKASSEVEIPAETIMFADSARLDRTIYDPEFMLQESFFGLDIQVWGSGRVHGRHNGLAHVMWIDGHVSAETPVPRSLEIDSPAVPPLELMKKHHLGDVFKFPRESPYASYIPSSFDSTDFYYYYTTKPPLD